MDRLEEVREQVLGCQRCELRGRCSAPVPIRPPVDGGSGERWAVLGEAPGRMEDKKGKPFVGPAGRYLRDKLKEAGLHPNNGHYLNTVSCWPKGKPSQDHLMACRDNLVNQWNAMEADYVLVCGSVALTAVMPRANHHTKNVPYKVHGKWIFPVYHPSYVLFHDPNSAPSWAQALGKFALIVQWGDVMAEALSVKCAYCRRLQSPACKEHMKDWRADQTWKRPPPPQLRLDLNV